MTRHHVAAAIAALLLIAGMSEFPLPDGESRGDVPATGNAPIGAADCGPGVLPPRRPRTAKV